MIHQSHIIFPHEGRNTNQNRILVLAASFSLIRPSDLQENLCTCYMCKITRPLQNSHLTYNKDKIFPSFGSFLSNALCKRSRKGNRGTKPSAAGHYLLPLKLIGWTSFCLRSVIGPSSSPRVPFNSSSEIQCAASAKRHIKTSLLVCA